MKLTPEIRDFLVTQNVLYCKRMSIKKPYPTLLYTVKEVYDLDNDLIRFKPKEQIGFSVFNNKERHMFMNPRKHKNVGELLDTLAHELVHIRWPKMQHGSKFQQRVNEVMMGYKF